MTDKASLQLRELDDKDSFITKHEQNELHFLTICSITGHRQQGHEQKLSSLKMLKILLHCPERSIFLRYWRYWRSHVRDGVALVLGLL